MPIEIINQESLANMVAQIRIKQKLICYSQNRLCSLIKNKLDDEILDKSYASIFNTIKYTTQELQIITQKIASYFQSLSVDDIGYPISCSKNHLIFKMCNEFLSDKDDSLISSLIRGKFYNNLPNEISSTCLPELGVLNTTEFWGNEVFVNSSALLYSVAKSLDITLDSKAEKGVLHFNPFHNQSFSCKAKDYSTEYSPFYNPYGSYGIYSVYGYGAGRYNTSCFSEVDCSSSVFLATHSLDKIKYLNSFNTTLIRRSYTNTQNKYRYKAITSNVGDEVIDVNKVNPGDIYLRGYHTVMVAEVNGDDFIGVGFARDLERPQNKICGGGTYKFDLSVTDKTKPIYILRKESACSFKEVYSLSDFLQKIDYKCDEYFHADEWVSTSGMNSLEFLNRAY